MNFKPIKLSEEKISSPEKNCEYYYFAARESCLMRDEVYNRYGLNHGVKWILYLPSGQIWEYYHDKKSFITFLKKLALKMQRQWPTHLLKYTKTRKQLIINAQKLSAATKKNNRKEILNAYTKYIQCAYTFSEYIWSPWAVISVMEPEFYKKFPQADIIGTLDQPIEFLKMQHDSIKLTPTQLEKKYSYLNIYNPFDKPYSKPDLKCINQKITQNNVEDQLKRLTKNKIEFKMFVNTLPKKWKLKAEIIHQYAFLKTDRIDAWKISMFCLNDLCKYLTKINPGLTIKNASFLSIHEIITILKGRPNINIKKIKTRSKNAAVYLLTPQTEVVSYSPTEIKLQKKLITNQNKTTREITGVTACRGVAQGRAVIINHSEDIKKIKKGNIFVARYTFPSFTPFMKISAAIVTDEGGLTSHAAIIARELNIPCIVGSKIGTKLLTDGDLLKVDANAGVVKILKKKRSKI